MEAGDGAEFRLGMLVGVDVGPEGGAMVFLRAAAKAGGRSGDAAVFLGKRRGTDFAPGIGVRLGTELRG